MANRVLTKAELENLFVPLFKSIQKKLEKICADDPKLLWAFRRKLAKELTYLERGKPAHRKKLKRQKFLEQKGKCAICKKKLFLAYSVLDRKRAMSNYTVENTRLVHSECDYKYQFKKAYS